MNSTAHLGDDQLVGLSLELYAPAEESRLLVHATGCERCAGALQAQLGDLERLRARRRAAPARTARPRGVRRWLVPGLAAAAAAAALLLMLPRPSPVDPGWMELPPALLTRSGDADRTAQLLDALQPYLERDAGAAVRSLRALEVEGTLALVRDCYLASALVQAGDEEGARELLRELLAGGSLPQPWRERCEALADHLGLAR